MDNTQYVLEMDNITKEYSGNQVLKGVNLHIKPGEIHALMGENGAGKSTLMNILFGMPVIHSTGGFGGTLKMAGQPVDIDTPLKAMELGIGMVHQEFMLIPGFTVTENIKIGREISTPNLVSRVFGKAMEGLDVEAMAKDARKALKTIGLQIEDYVKVAGLPVGYMQFIEIAREIDKTGIRLLVFDEPTAVLTESEADRLLEAMRVIASQGIAIIFITHRLDEVMAVADGMTILRDGEFVARREIKDTNVVEIAELMIGRKVEKLVDTSEEDRRVINDRDIAVSLKDYYVDMPGEQVKGINLDIRKGEIFGIGGLAGQGKLGIPNGIMGLYKAQGQVLINGEPLNLDKLKNNASSKILYVTSETFTNELIDAIRNKNNITTTEFREKYRNNDVLLIDDIQFIIGKESTQEEFFHTFNTLYESKKQIIISSDKPPKEIETLEERLRSRFEWGLTVDIQSPDYETRMAILRKKEEMEGYNIDNEVIKYIATNIKSNIRELEGALTKIVALSRLNKCDITLGLAEEALKDIISPNAQREVTPELIIQVVSDHFGLTPLDISSQKRNKEIVYPRQIVMYLCRDMTATPLQAIGRVLGGRDHTTIIHGAEKIAGDMAKDENLRSTIEILKKKINPQ